MQSKIKSILLAEDDPRDGELTLAGFADHHLANKVVVVCNGEEALACLHHRGAFQARTGGNPVAVMLSSSRGTPDLAECHRHGVNACVVKPVGSPDFMEAVNQLGFFWAAVHEPPPDNTQGRAAVQTRDGDCVKGEEAE